MPEVWRNSPPAQKFSRLAHYGAPGGYSHPLPKGEVPAVVGSIIAGVEPPTSATIR